MRLSVSEIFKRVASTVNQEATAPATTSSEYTLWMSYLNRSLHEWSESWDWEELRKNYFPTITGAATATVPLPLDFKKFASPVVLHGAAESADKSIPDILPEDKNLYSATDSYLTVMGDLKDGKNMLFHPGTLASGASLEVAYFSMPTLLSSATSIPPLSDSQFLIERVIAYIFESRSDARFQQMESKARNRLTMMIENAAAAKYNSYNNPNPVNNTLRRSGFRMGRD